MSRGVPPWMTTETWPRPRRLPVSSARRGCRGPGSTPPGAINAQTAADAAPERELALTRELLDAERRRADRLDSLLAEGHQASAELRRRLGRALGETSRFTKDG